MSFNPENKVEYNELGPILQSILNDKNEKKDFKKHNEDEIRHIIQEERNYWNDIERICKAYTDQKCKELEERLTRKINAEASRAKSEESSLWAAINSLSDDIDNVSNKVDDIQDNYNNNAISRIAAYGSETTEFSNILSGSKCSGIRLYRDFTLEAAGNQYIQGTKNIMCTVTGGVTVTFLNLQFTGPGYLVVPVACPVNIRPNASYGNTHALTITPNDSLFRQADVIRHFNYPNANYRPHDAAGLILAVFEMGNSYGGDLGFSFRFSGNTIFTDYTPPSNGGWACVSDKTRVLNNTRCYNEENGQIIGSAYTDARLASLCGIYKNATDIPYYQR